MTDWAPISHNVTRIILALGPMLPVAQNGFRMVDETDDVLGDIVLFVLNVSQIPKASFRVF